MSHRDPDGDPTYPDARATNGASGSRVISGESTPPDEHTRRVEALKKQKDGESSSNLKVHDDPASREERFHKAFKPGDATTPSVEAAAPIPAAPMRSTELSERSRKQKRRERDRRAERTAVGALILMFLVIGGAGYWISSSIIDEPAKPPTPEELALAKAQAALKAAEKKAATTSHLDETPDLPALRMMMSEGLTIAAEGLPEVSSNTQTPEAGVLAAIETCRFAYGVWEFSPNKRFRFLTTCEGKDGQILVGAYEISGSKVTLSPLVDGPGLIVSELEVEKPSTMTTKVGYGPITLDVKQRINTVRGGMDGEAFRATYEPRNTLPTPGVKQKSKDPLLEAIQQPQN